MSKRSKSLPPSVMSVEVVEEIFEQLKGLSPQEQAIIRPVLERDLEFQRREKARVRQLKSMVDMHLVDQGSSAPPLSARRRSAYGLMNSLSSDSMMSVCSLRSNKPSLTAKPATEQPSGRVCHQCQTRLGIIFNAGTRCSKCGRLLCTNCRFPTTARSKWLCQACHTQRELIAASGEWVDGGDPAEISEVLLAQMRRAAIEKEKMEGEKSPNGQPRAPMLSKRNLTLPTIATPSLLAVPSESEITANNNLSPSQKFWGGSPSPRSPQQYLIGSPNYVNITVPTPPPDALHPDVCQREIVGSPSPRSNPTFLMGNSPVRGGAVPITEVAPPTPTNSGQLRSPMSGSRRTAFANSKRLSTTIDNDKLLQPVDRQQPVRRQPSVPAAEPEQWGRNSRIPAPTSNQREQRAHSSGHVQTLAPSRNSTRGPAASNPDMRQRDPTKATAKANPYANVREDRQRMSVSRPGDDYAIRRQRPHSQGPVTVRKVKAQAYDRLDVSSCDSRRSSGISLPSRSTSQEARMYKGGRVTPASSRDSLSVASLATETSTDGCTKQSVASQAATQTTPYLGEVQLILSYDIRSACFCVHVIQCRSLPHFGNHKPNPYVKAVLVSRDNSVAVLKNKTTPRKGEVNPVFDHILKFPRITKSELEQYQLIASVWHKDLLAQNAPIGEVSINLKEHNWESACPAWYQLEGKPVVSGSPTGSMSVEDGECSGAHSTDVLAVGPRTPDRTAVAVAPRRAIFRNASTNSSTSSRNSRGVRKAVLQRKADGTEEERESTKGTGRKSVELEHDISSSEPQRSTSKESEVEDQATDWTIWV